MKQKKTSTAVEFKPVIEVLGFKEEDFLETDESETDAEIAFAGDAKGLDLLLRTVNKQLDGFIRDYEKDPSDPSDVETAYTFKLHVLAGMAKLFSPLSSYGRDRLKEVRKCSREYESFVAALTTRITRDNIESFSKVLSPDILEDVAVGKVSGIGSVRYKDGERYGVGAIVYKIDNSPFIGENIGRILWLYVHEDFRMQGIADHLISELLGSMIENGVEYITINALIGPDINLERLKAYLMSSWMFDLETTMVPDALIRVGDIKNASRLKEHVKDVRALSDLKDGVNANGVKNALRRLGHPSYLSGDLFSTDYIDQNLSFFLGTETSITGLLLTHRLPSEKIRVEYLKAEDENIELQKKMVAALLKAVYMQCSEETLLSIPLDSEELAFFTEEICPVQMGQYMLEGLLAPQTGTDEDLDLNIVRELLEYEDAEFV